MKPGEILTLEIGPFEVPVRNAEGEKLFAQAYGWEFPELCGRELRGLHGFVTNTDRMSPDKLILELADGEIHSFFMSAGGCWRQLDSKDLAFECEEYEDAKVIDYSEVFQLRSQQIHRVWCPDDERVLRIHIQLESGLLTLREGDWRNPEATDVIEFSRHLPNEPGSEASLGTD